MNAIIKNDAASEGDHQKTVQEHSSGGAGDVVVLTVLDAHHFMKYKWLYVYDATYEMA